VGENRKESNGSGQAANDLNRTNPGFAQSETSPMEGLELSEFVAQNENTTTTNKIRRILVASNAIQTKDNEA
jgi:hypothetical protein